MTPSIRILLSLILIGLLSLPHHSVEVCAQTVTDAPPSDSRNRKHAPPATNVFPSPDWPSPMKDQNHLFVLADVLEYRPKLGGTGNTDDYRWDIEGWYGGDYHRLWFKSEGQQNSAFKADYDIDSQLLYGRFFQQYYDIQIGGRLETQSFRGRNVTRGLAVLGLQGLVPYNYEIECALFLSHRGHVSARVTATKDLFLSQQLILQLRLETNAALQRAKKFTTGSGLNNFEGGARIRYEIRRKFAPYIGVSLDRSFSETATLVREEGGDRSQVRFVVGVRLWW